VKADLNTVPTSSESSGPDSLHVPSSSFPLVSSSKDSLTLYDGIDLHNNAANIIADPNNPDMEVFSTMVREYLSLQVMRPSLSSGSKVANTPTDFVYDVFYYHKKEIDGKSTNLDQLANVGLVMVRPEDQIEFLNVSDDETDSDYVEDEDPDSNDENNPANDYPEETDSEDANWGSYQDRDYSDEEVDEFGDDEDKLEL